MKPTCLITTLSKIIFASCLLFLPLIYSSCNQKAPAGQPDKPFVTDTPTLESPTETIATSATSAASLGSPVHNVAETMERYEQMEKEYQEYAKAFADTTAIINSMETLVAKVDQLKKDSDPAVEYFAQHRSEFSKAQVKKIQKNNAEISKQLTIILNALQRFR